MKKWSHEKSKTEKLVKFPERPMVVQVIIFVTPNTSRCRAKERWDLLRPVKTWGRLSEKEIKMANITCNTVTAEKMVCSQSIVDALIAPLRGSP